MFCNKSVPLIIDGFQPLLVIRALMDSRGLSRLGVANGIIRNLWGMVPSLTVVSRAVRMIDYIILQQEFSIVNGI